MPERGTIDAVLISMAFDGYEKSIMLKEKSCMCFVDLEKTYYRVPRKVLEWAMRKKAIPEVLVRSTMSFYVGARTRVRVDSELSEECEAKVGMYQGSVLSPFLLAVVVDVVTVFARGCAK